MLLCELVIVSVFKEHIDHTLNDILIPFVDRAKSFIDAVNYQVAVLNTHLAQILIRLQIDAPLHHEMIGKYFLNGTNLDIRTRIRRMNISTVVQPLPVCPTCFLSLKYFQNMMILNINSNLFCYLFINCIFG